MTKIEEVARAIRAAQTGWDMPADDWTYADLESHGLIAEARAAIEAMRDASPEQIHALNDFSERYLLKYGDEPDASDIYECMLDAALAEDAK